MSGHGGGRGAAGQKAPAFRSRKIDPRRQLPVLRENELGDGSDTASHQIVPVATTGVEKEEEEEEHLQLALATHYGSDAKTFIPVPEADKPFDEYDQFYPKNFVLPKTLIRFSAPIEEYIGCPYNMDGEDDSWLAEHNAKCDRGELSKHARLTEDQFEELMWGLEKITQEKNWVDPWSNKFSPHLGEMATLEDLETYLKTTSALLPASRQVVKHPNLKAAAAAVFAHWSERRKARDNRPIQPTIKTEDTGANDAYICFRRREARPMRKTRRVDQQSMDKVRQLRQQMDAARNLLDLVTKRERYRKESLILEELIFQQKIIVRRMKKKLGVAASEDVSPMKKNPVPRDRPTGSTRIFIPVNKLREAGHFNPMAEHERQAENRKRKREEDERMGYVDLTENPYVPQLPTHPGDRYFREDYTELLSYPSPLSEDGVVPTFLLQTGDPEVDFNVPFLPDKEMEDGRRDTALRARFGRVRIGRGGRRIQDRRCAMSDLFSELGPQHAYLPGEPESRWKRAPEQFEMENDAKVRQERQEKLSRYRWGDSDDEDLAIAPEDGGIPLFDNTSAKVFRYGLISETDYKSLEVIARIPTQAEPRIGGTRNPQATMPPPQVIRGPPPAIPQQQQAVQVQQQVQVQAQQQAAAAAAQQAKKKAAAAVGARLSTDNLAALAAGPSSGQLTIKPPGKPTKGEEDPKAAAVKMLMREAAKGAQQIQQMSSQLQAQAQMRNQQQALQGNFQAPLAQLVGAQTAAALSSPNLSAALGSPVMNSGGGSAQQSPGSPALNGGPVLSPTKIAAAQTLKNSILTAGVLGASPATSPGTANGAAANAAALQQQQRAQMMRSRQQGGAAGAQLAGNIAQANVAGGQQQQVQQQILQQQLANMVRNGQLRISNGVPVMLQPNAGGQVTFAANGLSGSPPRANGAQAQQMLAQIQQRIAMAGNAGQNNAVLATLANSLMAGQQMADLGDDDGDGK